MQLQSPSAGTDVRELWRYVEQLTHIVNALTNMTVLIEGETRLTGKLEIREGASFLLINSNTEVGNAGT